MKNSAEQIRSRLLAISISENVAYQHVQTKFLLERMVARLTAKKKLFDSIVFKGGYVALRVFNSSRYTMDLDALIRNTDIASIEDMVIAAVESSVDDGTWFKYEKKADLQTLGEYGGTRFYFRCGIGEMPEKYMKAQSIHLDLAAGDAVTPAPVNNKIQTLIGDNILSWKTYTIETATAEKLHTLIIRGSDNSRSKDVYDLNLFLPQCKTSILKDALAATFSSRSDTLPYLLTPIISGINRDLLKKGWKNTTAGLTVKVTMDEAFETIIEYCRMLDNH